MKAITHLAILCKLELQTEFCNVAYRAIQRPKDANVVSVLSSGLLQG